MKPKLRHTALALAIAALWASPAAFAQEEPPPPTRAPTTPTTPVDGGDSVDKDVEKTFTEEDFIRYDNQLDVHLVKKSNVEKEVFVEGTVHVDGRIAPDSSAMAIVDDKQINIKNEVLNLGLPNTATGSVEGGTGNIGANVGAGTYIQQGNEAALAAASDNNKATHADAQAFIFQDIEFAFTENIATTNQADGTVGGYAGNVGLNVAAGTNLQQKNILVAAVGPGALAEAVSYKKQQIDNNSTFNVPLAVDERDSFGETSTAFLPTTNTATLTVTGGAGNLGLNVAAGTAIQQANDLSIAVTSSGVNVSGAVQ